MAEGGLSACDQSSERRRQRAGWGSSIPGPVAHGRRRGEAWGVAQRVRKVGMEAIWNWRRECVRRLHESGELRRVLEGAPGQVKLGSRGRG